MKRFIALLWLVLAVAIAAPAVAQQPVPPDHYTLDPRGVDLVSGTFNYATTEVAIGGAGGLSYGRAFIGAGAGWRDLNSGTLTTDPITGELIVSVGPYSEIFVWNGFQWVSKYNNGSTYDMSVPGVITVIDRSGVKLLFELTGGYDSNYGSAFGLISEIQTPNGERTNYHYKIQEGCEECYYGLRLQGISNNRGYVLKYTYRSNSTAVIADWLRVQTVTGINTAVDYCDPSADACTGLTRTWPSVSYSNNEPPLTATDQSSRTTTYAYTAGGYLDTVQFPGSSSADIDVAYNGSDQVSGVTDASGAWTYTYSDVGTTRTTTVSGPLSQAMTVVSSLTTGRASSVTDAASNTWSYTYDSDLRLDRATQPEGNYAEFDYDGRSNMIRVTQVAKSGSGLSNIVTETNYPSACTTPYTQVNCNLPTSSEDALGNVTTYDFSETHGGLESVTYAAVGGVSPQTRYTYSAQTAYYKNSGGTIVAAPTSITLPTLIEACITGSSCDGTANEVQSTLTYGSTGVANNLQVTSVSRGAGDGSLTATTALTYDANGDLQTVDGPLSGSGDKTEYRYDAARQVIGVVGPDPDGGGALLNRARRMTYDSRGNVTLIEAGTTPGYTNTDWSNFATLQRQAMTYDSYGRPTHTRQQSSGGTTYGLVQTSYDAAGRPSCVTVRMNPAGFTSPPSSACTAGTAGYFGPDRITTLSYNSLGQVVSTTTATGTADAATEAATYTDNGRPESLTDGNGNVSVMVYDGFDRLYRLRYPNATGGGTSTTDYEQYGYDANGQVVSYRDRANQTSTTTYDALNRPSLFTPPTAYDQNFVYDNLGRLTSLYGYPPYAWSMSWTYDALGRQLTQTGAFGGMTLTSAYDLAGRRTRLTWPDSVYVTYDYDLYGGVTAVKLSGSTSLSAYAYDDLGRLTGITRGNGASTSYGYDAVSRLTSLVQNPTGSTNDVTVTLAYNPAGQIFSRAVSNSSYIYAPATGTTGYTVNGLNRVTVAGGTSVTYDANGNVTGGLGATLGYDDQSNLGSAAGTTTWLHDPMARIYNQVVSGTTTRFAYDGMKLATEYSGSSGTTIAARHIPGLWMDDIALSYSGSGTSTPSWPLTDERGSVIALTDNTGAVTAINTYDEYGVPASANTGRFQYTGQVWLPTAGLHDYKMRAYAQGAGRFVQTDPLGYTAGANLYGYVGGDPGNRIDPLGLEWITYSCTKISVIGVGDPDSTTMSYSRTAVRSTCTKYIPDEYDWLTGTPDFYLDGLNTWNASTCGTNAQFVNLTFYPSPAGFTGIPTAKPGTLVVVGSASADLAAGFGFSGEIGIYTYEATNGITYRGLFGSPGLAVGLGASLSGGIGAVRGLENFFGDGWSVSGQAGVLSGELSGGDQGFTGGQVGAGIGAGAWGTASYTHPIGPAFPICESGVQ